MGTRSATSTPPSPSSSRARGWAPTPSTPCSTARAASRGSRAWPAATSATWSRADGRRPRARLAVDVFTRRVKKYVGAYAALLGGVDAIVFTGGIGENSASVRAAVCDGLLYMGVQLDAARNADPAAHAVVGVTDVAAAARPGARAGARHRRGAHDRPRGHALPPRPHRGDPQRAREAHPRGGQRAPRAPVPRGLRRPLRPGLRAHAAPRRDPEGPVRHPRDGRPGGPQGGGAQRGDHQPAARRDPGGGRAHRRLTPSACRPPLRESGQLATPRASRSAARAARWPSRGASSRRSATCTWARRRAALRRARQGRDPRARWRATAR
jgi:hypothetical protein